MGLTVGELNILLEGEVDDFVRETRRARNELDRFANQAEDRTTAANRGFDVLALGVFGVVTAITALGAAIATIGLGRLSIDAVAAEASFGRLLGQIQTLVGVSVEELAELRQGVLDISRETGRGPEELADALFAVTSAGQRGAEALETLRLASQASAAGLGETRSVALAAVAATTAFADQSLTTAEAFDVLLGTVREGNLEAASLASTLGRVLGPAAQVGASFADVGASVAAFTRLGVSAEEAVTGLQSTFALLLSPTEQSAQALAEVGLTARDLRESIGERGLARTLVDLVQRFQALGPAGQELLAEAIPNIRAFSSVLGTAAAQSEEFIRINDALANSSGALETAFSQTTNRLDFSLSLLTSGFERLRIAFGEALAPGVFAALQEVVLPLFAEFETLISENRVALAQFAREGIGAAVNALGPFLRSLAFGVAFLEAIVQVFQVIEAALRAFALGLLVVTTPFVTLIELFRLLSDLAGVAGRAIRALAERDFRALRDAPRQAEAAVQEFATRVSEQLGDVAENALETERAFQNIGEAGVLAGVGTGLLNAADAAERAGRAINEVTEAQEGLNDAREEGDRAGAAVDPDPGGQAAAFTEDQNRAFERLEASARRIELAEIARLDPLSAQLEVIEDQIAALRELEAESGRVGAADEAVNALLRQQARLRTEAAQARLEADPAEVQGQIGQLARIDPEAARTISEDFARALDSAQTDEARRQVVEKFGRDLQTRLDAVTPPPLSEQIEGTLRSGFRAFLEGDAPNITQQLGGLVESRLFDSLENAFARSLDTFDQAFGDILDAAGNTISGLFDGLGGEDGILGGLGGLGGAIAGALPLIGAGISSALQRTEVQTTTPELDRGDFQATEQAVRGIVSGGVDVPIFRVGQQIERANEGVISAIDRQTTTLVAAIVGTGGAAGGQPAQAAANLLEEESITIA